MVVMIQSGGLRRIRTPPVAFSRRRCVLSTHRLTQSALPISIYQVLLSFQLYVEKDNLGALNLYSYRPDAFDDESEHVALMFASHAAVAFADAQRIDQLNHKAATRDLIGQAKGILMERYNINADRAFAVLVRVSQHNIRKLRDVAEELVSSGRLRDLEPRPDAAAT
jgi:hypothetical protein